MKNWLKIAAIFILFSALLPVIAVYFPTLFGAVTGFFASLTGKG